VLLGVAHAAREHEPVLPRATGDRQEGGDHPRCPGSLVDRSRVLMTFTGAPFNRVPYGGPSGQGVRVRRGLDSDTYVAEDASGRRAGPIALRRKEKDNLEREDGSR